MTKGEIEEARRELKEILAVLADAGVALGKPAEEVAAVRHGSPFLIDQLCDAALASLRPEVAAPKLSDNAILNAAIAAADALDATRVSEMRAGGCWHATTIFDGDTGLLRFGRLVEEMVRGRLPQGDSHG